MPPIDNQQDMKTWCRIYLFDCSCASAFAGLCNYLFQRSVGRQSSVSRLFIYYNGQMIQQHSVYERASRYTVIPLHLTFDINAIEICLHNQLSVLIGIRLIQQNFQRNGGYLQGYHGYFYLSYEYLTHPCLIDDIGGLWSILKIIPRTTTLPTVRRLVLS
ncbi:unnamed protein product [Adineta steineri]|uniref:Uncharacterized protein n=1 Tax=Adineta steineri TaxID=433720 RepID=A0A813T7L0_9BILA|nr:unnamed protein product [Adineta steineri]CAF3998338.1 unnamed protein product [Adineta steineri]